MQSSKCKARSAKLEIQSSKYKARSAKIEVQSSKYKARSVVKRKTAFAHLLCVFQPIDYTVAIYI